MKLITKVFLIVLLFAPLIPSVNVRAAEKSGSTIERIDQLFAEGKINYGDKLFYNLQSIYSADSLPEDIRTDSVEFLSCATDLIMEAYQNWDRMSPEQQTLASSYLTRAGFDAIYISPESNFSIYYDTVGNEAVPSEDIDVDGIPDYVERIGIYADSSYVYYHNTLGYLPVPRVDENPYKIYLVKIAAYGATVPESPGDSSWGDYTSHIEIHCTFDGPSFGPNDDPEGRVIGDQKVTCAHEYYHAVQFAYDYNYNNLWWMECTSVYFEDVLFPEVNDNYNYLTGFYDYPDTFLYVPNYHAYTTFIWPSFLAEKFGIDILKKSYEYLRYYDVMPSVDSALSTVGKRIRTVFPEFTLWNYFTYDRADAAYHNDAVDYPPIEIDQTVTDFPAAVVEPSNPPDGLSSNYIICYPNPAEEGFFMFQFAGSPYVEWGLTNIIFDNTGEMNITEYDVDYYGKTHWGAYDFATIDSMVVIPCVISRYIDDNHYELSVDTYSYGDVDFSGGTPNVLDIVYIINQIYKQGPGPNWDARMSDINCDESYNILDIIYLINSIYKGGPDPGPCRY